MARVVLVTGVSGPLGADLARRIATTPEVRSVVGVDTVAPRDALDGVRFVRADIRNPVITKVIAGEDVDTVVHTSVTPPMRLRGARASAKEHNVIGTMQLLAGCQRAASVERLVVKSSAEIYGSTHRDPAMFTEDMAARRAPTSGFAKDVLEIEGYVRGFARRRPDVNVTILRNANTVGPGVRSPLTDYFRLPAIPRPLGFDARLQLLHYQDLLGALRHAAFADVAGTFNLAGSGTLMLSQAIRRLGRPSVPLPTFALSSLGKGLQPAGLLSGGLAPEQIRFLTFGRGLDVTRTREVLGFTPAYTTEQAFEDFARSLGPGLIAQLSGDAHG